MTIETKALLSGGGFTSKFASPNVLIASGATGTIATITPPAGQKVKLTALGGASTITSLTTVTVNGVDIITAVRLEAYGTPPNSVNELLIGYSGPNQHAITGDVNEVFEIKTDVATTNDISYAYQFGE